MSITRPGLGILSFSAAATALIVAGHAIAQSGEPDLNPPGVASPATEQSPFLGEWELDLTRMPDTYGPPPQRVRFTFEDAGSGEWRTKVEITGRDGSVRHVAMRYRRDGRAVQGEGDDADGDTAAFISPDPNVLVMNMAKNKTLAGVRVYAISADGKEMTESAAGIDQDGAPFVRNFHFRRIR
jgi:hypothetical protein